MYDRTPTARRVRGDKIEEEYPILAHCNVSALSLFNVGNVTVTVTDLCSEVDSGRGRAK